MSRGPYRVRRGKLEMYLALLFAYNGITKRTRIMEAFCGISATPGKKINLFLMQNGFIERVDLCGTLYTYKRTDKGDGVVDSLINGDMRYLIDDSLLKIYERSEKERKLLEFKASHKRNITIRRSIAAQKMSVLDLLKHGARYPSSRIMSYSLATERNIIQILEDLEKAGLIVLYPNRYKKSVGDYGISAMGRKFILKDGKPDG